MGPEYYVIDPAKCTECVGHHEEPQCMVVCPVDCIAVNPEFVESEAQLMQKFKELTGQSETETDPQEVLS